MAEKSIPFLRKTGQVWELFVDERPFLMRGIELHNSSMSSAEYMDTAWKTLVAMGVNTVLGAVYWNDIEPEEGRFDFSEFDAVLEGARSHGLRLVPLWFGSFKNGMSSHVPTWVTKNPGRFPRMLRKKDDKIIVSNTISTIEGENAIADAKAFKAFMAHLHEVDTHHTVIMVQVQNEVGLLDDSRDRSPAANKLFSSAVPGELIEYLRTEWEGTPSDFKATFPNLPSVLQKLGKSDSPSWTEVFGESNRADEIFMAYHYALYLEKVAAAGREVYAIPLYTNAWLPMPPASNEKVDADLVSGGGQPGEYPSGGPTSRLLDLWFKFAPSLDFISPDIYFGVYGDILTDYSHKGKPMFIPEQRRDEHGARRMWEAVGSHGALGVCPFGVDSLPASEFAYTKHFKLMESVSGILTQARLRPESMFGFFLDEFESAEADKPIIKRFSEFELTITRAFVFGKPGPAYGIIIEMEPCRFLFIGAGYKVQFAATSPTAVYTGVLHAEEKRVVDAEKGVLKTERRLNGDETFSGVWINMANEKPDYGDVGVGMLFPARTMVAEATLYSLDKSQVPGS